MIISKKYMSLLGKFQKQRLTRIEYAQFIKIHPNLGLVEGKWVANTLDFPFLTNVAFMILA